VWSASASTDFTHTQITNQNPENIFEGNHLSILEKFDYLDNEIFSIQLLLLEDDRFSVLN
jgi:hypothetical protein